VEFSKYLTGSVDSKVIWVGGVDDGIRDLKRLYILGWTDTPKSPGLLSKKQALRTEKCLRMLRVYVRGLTEYLPTPSRSCKRVGDRVFVIV
jgi:hypothetical protein